MRRVLALTLVAACVGLPFACDDEEEAALSAVEREQVAKIYADSVRALTRPTDSACTADRPGLVDVLVDSLFELRRADIESQQRVVE